jgi:hypothetical protein
MSPELARYKSDSDVRAPDPFPCDCWAFGICIYYVLIGDPLHLELSRITHTVDRDEDRETGRQTFLAADTLIRASHRWRGFLIGDILLNGLLKVDPESRSTADTISEHMKRDEFQEYLK